VARSALVYVVYHRITHFALFCTELLQVYGGNIHDVPRREIKQLSREPICFVWAVAAHPACDFYEGTSLVGLDAKVGIDAEMFILHTWYCDLWDVKANDKLSWGHDNSSAFVQKLRVFVQNDRHYAAGEDVKEQASTRRNTLVL